MMKVMDDFGFKYKSQFLGKDGIREIIEDDFSDKPTEGNEKGEMINESK